MRRSPAKPARATVRSRLSAPPRAREICLELDDHSFAQYRATEFFQLHGLREPHVQAARMAAQFVKQNGGLLSLIDVRMDSSFDGTDVKLGIQAGSYVGAIPLISPTTARPDYGLVVQPRFPWAGIGPMLSEMGWRISPKPLRLPLLRRSERRVPPWVLSVMILGRLKALLDSIDRRFELVTELRTAPRGTVHWPDYATKCLPRAAFLSIPCTFPDLRDDKRLKGAIRHSVERQLQSLGTQKEHGAFIHRLIEFSQQLLRRVQNVPVYIPSSIAFATWLQRPMRTVPFIDGLQAIEWTVEERGLAGLSDLEGIPWAMPMDQFFEAWVETAFRAVAQRTGGQIRVGRKQETTRPIDWEPPYLGSQKSLIPDIWIEWDSATLIVDAKYKRHWEELQQRSWSNLEAEVREQHRADLFQVLAYASLARTSRVIACLVYPCSPEHWESLRARGRLLHRAEFTVGDRRLVLWLTAIPMATDVERIAIPLADLCRALLAGA